MKFHLTIGVVILCFSVVAQSASTENTDAHYEKVENSSFDPGERIYFKATFGWFTVGEAELRVSEKTYTVNDRSCYKIDAYGKTTGLVDWLAKVDDHWGAYIDRDAFVPQRSYRYIKEGNYRKNEVTYYDHIKDSVKVQVYSRKFKKWNDPVGYAAKNNVRDMIGGFYYLRMIDFTKLKIGDIIEVHGFFEDTFYDLRVVYEGKDRIRTKVGVVNTIRLAPIMPDNTLFDGKDSIKAWLSDDQNKIPVKVEAKMFLGDAGIELTGTKNLRYPLNIKKR